MKVYEVNKEEFFKGYSLVELIKFKNRIKLIEKELSASNLENALSLTMDKLYVEIPEFNFYRINILIRMRHLDLALDVAENENFKNFKPIQTQKEGLIEAIRIRDEEEKRIKEEEKRKLEEQLREEEKKRQEEARRKAEEKKRQDNIINSQNSTYNNKAWKPKKNNGVSTPAMSTKRLLMTKLYVGVLTVEDIENANLAPFERALFMICYYDKYNHSAGLKYIKSIKGTFDADRERKMINNLRSRLESKRNNYFDIGYYTSYLSSIDFEYAQILEREKKEEENQRKLEVARQVTFKKSATTNNQKPLIEEPKVHEELETSNDNGVTEYNEPAEVEEVEEVEVAEEIIQQETIIPKVEDATEIRVVKVKKNKKEKKTKTSKPESTVMRIKEAFPIEAEAMISYVYVETNKQMTSRSMKAFDILESLLNQDVTNINALKRFQDLVISFSRDKRIGVTYNKERFGKYLKKEQD